METNAIDDNSTAILSPELDPENTWSVRIVCRSESRMRGRSFCVIYPKREYWTVAHHINALRKEYKEEPHPMQLERKSVVRQKINMLLGIIDEKSETGA